MEKLYNNQGFLTPEGEELLSKVLDPTLDKLLSNSLKENELRVMGSILSKRVSDLVFKKINLK